MLKFHFDPGFAFGLFEERRLNQRYLDGTIRWRQIWRYEIAGTHGSLWVYPFVSKKNVVNLGVSFPFGYSNVVSSWLDINNDIDPHTYKFLVAFVGCMSVGKKIKMFQKLVRRMMKTIDRKREVLSHLWLAIVYQFIESLSLVTFRYQFLPMWSRARWDTSFNFWWESFTEDGYLSVGSNILLPILVTRSERTFSIIWNENLFSQSSDNGSPNPIYKHDFTSIYFVGDSFLKYEKQC